MHPNLGTRLLDVATVSGPATRPSLLPLRLSHIEPAPPPPNRVLRHLFPVFFCSRLSNPPVLLLSPHLASSPLFYFHRQTPFQSSCLGAWTRPDVSGCASSLVLRSPWRIGSPSPRACQIRLRLQSGLTGPCRANQGSRPLGYCTSTAALSRCHHSGCCMHEFMHVPSFTHEWDGLV